jgi:hypothetical protein
MGTDSPRRRTVKSLATLVVLVFLAGCGANQSSDGPPSCKAPSGSVQPCNADRPVPTKANLKAHPEAASRALQQLAPIFGVTAYPNGRIPDSALCPITGGVVSSSWQGSGKLLCGGPAASWNAMSVYIHARTGIWLTTDGSLSAYRSIAGQVYEKNYWCARQNCGNAATPGYSNHGNGTAVDNPDYSLIRTYGPMFHWGIGYGTCSDAPWEQWHAHACGGYTGPNPGPYGQGGAGGGPKPFKVLKLNDGGPRVRALNCRYLHLARVRRAKGSGHYTHHGTRHYGPGMELATRHFQHDSHLGADGVYGEKSNGKMGPRWVRWKHHHSDPHCGAIGRG